MGYVYLIRGSKWHKIGVSIKPKKRLKSLDRTLLPFEPKIVALLKSDVYERIELELHGRYKSKRVRGEWFALSAEDIDEIINDYGFDVLADDINESDLEIKEFLRVAEERESDRLKSLKEQNKMYDDLWSVTARCMVSQLELKLKGIPVEHLLRYIPSEHWDLFIKFDLEKFTKIIQAIVKDIKRQEDERSGKTT